MFSIQFIRKFGDKAYDDLATIECIDVDKYKITYSDPTISKKMPFETNSSGVHRWLRRVLRLLEEDAEPFENLQLNLPAMPSTLFKVSNLANNYETILNAVEFYLDVISKPAAVETPQRMPRVVLDFTQPMTPQAKSTISHVCPPAPRRHIFFDEKGNECARPLMREIDFNY